LNTKFIGPNSAKILAKIVIENNPKMEVITISFTCNRNNFMKPIPKAIAVMRV
jgi:hypothetical protein